MLFRIGTFIGSQVALAATGLFLTEPISGKNVAVDGFLFIVIFGVSMIGAVVFSNFAVKTRGAVIR